MFRRWNRNIRFIGVGFVLSLGIIFFVLFLRPSYESIQPDQARMEETIQKLGDLKYEGKLTGSEGNVKALGYIRNQFKDFGLSPVAGADDYYQKFQVIVPQIDPQSKFSVVGSDGHQVNFDLYVDYTVITTNNGGGIDYTGELLLVGSNLFRIEPSQIKDKVVVIEASRLQPDWIDYVIEQGGKGILCMTDSRAYEVPEAIYHQKRLDVSRYGPSLLLGFISGNMYDVLKSAVAAMETEDAQSSNPQKSLYQVVKEAEIHIPITFPVEDTENLIAVLKGKSDQGLNLLISADFDGLGSGSNASRFEGAISENTSIAALMETARILSQQEELPFNNIVFALWNGQHENNAGSGFYLEHPLIPLEDTIHIHLNNIGIKSLDGTQLQSDSVISRIFKDQIAMYAIENKLQVELAGPMNQVAGQFSDDGVPTVTITDARPESFPENTQFDSTVLIDQNTLLASTQILLGYIGQTYYQPDYFDYLRFSEILLLGTLIILLTFSLVLEYWYRYRPNNSWMGMKSETLYYNVLMILIRRFSFRVIPYGGILFLLSFLANIKQTTDVQTVNGHMMSNFSLFITLKRTILYLRSFFSPEFYGSQDMQEIILVIKESGLMSIKLIGGTMIIAMIGGILWSLLEHLNLRLKKNTSLITLFIFSIPDVFVVLTGLALYTWIYLRFPQIKDLEYIKGYVIPLLTLSIVPVVYIARITTVSIEEEIQKPYFHAAKAWGYSPFKIFTSEMLPALIFKVIDSMPTLMTMILSNMLIVEYLFNYNGMGYYLLYLYEREDTVRFVPVAVALGLVYVCFTLGFKGIGRVINPMKREGTQ